MREAVVEEAVGDEEAVEKGVVEVMGKCAEKEEAVEPRWGVEVEERAKTVVGVQRRQWWYTDGNLWKPLKSSPVFAPLPATSMDVCSVSYVMLGFSYVMLGFRMKLKGVVVAKQ